MQEEQILCACSAYEQKYYLNPRYASLPSAIQDELLHDLDTKLIGSSRQTGCQPKLMQNFFSLKKSKCQICISDINRQ